MKSLYLFTTDLRLEDNETLNFAISNGPIIFGVLKKDLSHWGASRRNFYIETLNQLRNDLMKYGQKLYLIEDINEFSKVYLAKQYNHRLAEIWENYDGEVIEKQEQTLFNLSELGFGLTDLPRTFTPFRNKMDKLIPETDLSSISHEIVEASCQQEEYIGGEVFSEGKLQGGEGAGLKRLKEYFSRPKLAKSYFETRNGMIKFDDSTKFSPWLALGSIHPKRIFSELKKFESEHGSNKSTYWIYFELLWRDYFKFLSLSNFEITKKQGEYSAELFSKWADARTDEDFVNANMVELNTSGWMSNRGRQNVASYFCKHLNLPWEFGAKYFEQHLIDFDYESNWGNWTYLAGVGVDPRDRKFNIKKQANDFDPTGEYRRKFLC